MSDDQKKISEVLRLQCFIEAENISYEELAELSGASLRTVKNTVYENKPIGMKLLRGLQKKRGVSIDWLLKGEGEMYLSRSDPLVTEQPTMYRQDVAVQAKEAAVVTTGVNNGSIVAEGRRQQYNKDLGERGMRLCAFVQWWMACHDADDQAWLEKQVERAVPEFAAWKQELDKNR